MLTSDQSNLTMSPLNVASSGECEWIGAEYFYDRNQVYIVGIKNNLKILKLIVKLSFCNEVGDVLMLTL